MRTSRWTPVEATRHSNIETEPQRNHLPHPLSLLLCPCLQRLCTCMAFSLLETSTRGPQTVDTQLTQIVQRLSELLRDVERIRASTLMVKEIVLRGECHELREIAFTSPVGIMALRIRIVVVCKGISWTGHQCARVGSERLNQRCDGMLRSFFAEG